MHTNDTRALFVSTWQLIKFALRLQQTIDRRVSEAVGRTVPGWGGGNRGRRPSRRVEVGYPCGLFWFQQVQPLQRWLILLFLHIIAKCVKKYALVPCTVYLVSFEFIVITVFILLKSCRQHDELCSGFRGSYAIHWRSINITQFETVLKNIILFIQNRISWETSLLSRLWI